WKAVLIRVIACVNTTPIAAIARSTWMDSRRPARNASRSPAPAIVMVVIVVTQQAPLDASSLEGKAARAILGTGRSSIVAPHGRPTRILVNSLRFWFDFASKSNGRGPQLQTPIMSGALATLSGLRHDAPLRKIGGNLDPWNRRRIEVTLHQSSSELAQR